MLMMTRKKTSQDETVVPPEAQLIDIKKAAEILAVSEGSIRNLVERGKLTPAYPAGRALRFRLGEVLTYSRNC